MSLLAAVTQETRAIMPCRKFEGHAANVSGVIHLPGGHQIMTCSYDGSLRVWDLQSGKQIGNDWQDGKSGVRTIELSPGGKKVFSGSNDGAMRLWDVDTGKAITLLAGHTSPVLSLCWNRDSRRVVSGAFNDGTARVWDVESGKTVLAIGTGFSSVYTVSYSPDSTMIATGGHGHEEYLKIWDAKTGKLVANLKGHRGAVECLAWTANGKMLICGSWDYLIRTWNTTTWQQIVVLAGHTNTVAGIAISPNGRILASTSWDDTARLWNLEHGQPIGSPLQHDNRVECTSFLADGKLLATGCMDKNAYAWDISAVIKEAGLSDLLLNPADKYDAGDTQRRGDWRRNPYLGPSSDSPHHHHLAGRYISSPSSAHQQHISAHISSHKHAPPGPISSPSRGNNDIAGSSPIQPRFLEWVRNPFSTTQNKRCNESIELPKRRTEVVDDPLTRGRPRIYSRREVEMKKEKQEEKRAAMKEKRKRNAKDAKNTKNISAGSSWPSQSNVAQQPGDEARTPPVPEPDSIGVPTSPTTFVIVANSAGTAHRARFWSAACCASTQNADGDH